MSFNRLNNFLGWSVFIFAFVVYFLTLEPANSLWDCSEYIASSVKFQVGHPPGAPLFQMIGSIISTFAIDSKKAFVLNTVSVIYASLGIMFLFWTITYFIKKIILKTKENFNDKSLIIFGSAIVGAIGFTFTDTYWFNAVESEVYAMMNCSTVMVFWLATKWDRNFGKPNNDKWLLLIALIIGLSPSIRFTIMLTIPSIVMMYYFNITKEVTTKGFIKANVLGIVITMFVFQGIFPFLFKYFAKMELFFVNSIGLPFNFGAFIGGIILIVGIIYGLMYCYKNNMEVIYKSLLGLLFILIGFSCYTTLMVRANAGTSINENDPSSFPSLSDYYHRKQYGELYNFWGPMFTAKLDKNNPYLDGTPTYEKNIEEGIYEMIEDGKQSLPNYDKKHVGFFPRMFSRDESHIQNYKRITGVSGKTKPGLLDNIRFFILYQQKYMYFRYLFWNFVGKQNDRQGEYDAINGNWISGIDFIDRSHAGPQGEDLTALQKNNEGRNTYYFLPLILAILGMVFHYKKDKYSFYSVLLFFVLSGIAIITYTNAKPFEPRERHYVFAVSFWTFSIWMGIGIYSCYDYLTEKINNVNKKALALGVIFIWSLAVPVILAKENWADHDRSNRFVGRDSAKAYLDSCEENAILFVYGDNDTFPLWYIQEVEGYRRDVRVINTSLFETDWYIDQMKTQYYDEMKPVASQLTHKQYRTGTRDVLYFRDLGDAQRQYTIQEFVNFISSDSPNSILKTQSGKNAYIFPTKNISIPVDKQKIISKNYISPKNYDKILDKIEFKINSDYLTKKDYMSLDIIANTNWDRPIYFAISGGGVGKNVMWLDNYLQQEGFAFKLVPIKTESKRGEQGFVDSEKTYNNTKKWGYGNLNKITMTYDADRRVASSYRNVLARLSKKLIEEGDTLKSIEIADKSIEEIPLNKYKVDFYTFIILESYYMSKDIEKARKLVSQINNQLKEDIVYYKKIKQDFTANMELRYSENYHMYLKEIVSSFDKDFMESINI